MAAFSDRDVEAARVIDHANTPVGVDARPGSGSYGMTDKEAVHVIGSTGIVDSDDDSTRADHSYGKEGVAGGIDGGSGSGSGSNVHDVDWNATSYGRLFAPLRRLELAMDRKLGVEAQGPARVLPEAREKPNPLNMFCLWASATMNLSAFATGLIGPGLGLDLRRTVPIAVGATLTGALVSGWCATQGPRTGLRQVSISRYSVGWWPSKLIALLNFVEQLGWASVACITGGLALTAVSDGHVSLVLGVIIVALVAFTISFFGLRALLRYEAFAWIPIFIIFLIIYGEAGPLGDNTTITSLTGADFSAACLTWFSIVYGSTSSWAVVTSDYYVQYPVDTPSRVTFTYTVLGMFVPTCFSIVLGCVVGSTILVNDEWSAANEAGLGYLIQVILHPNGFNKFVLVILVLSGIGNTCLCIYSAALSAQQFARPFMAIPRTLWTIVVLACVLLLGLVGRDHLQEYLENFLALLGYWNTSFFVILFIEHYLFRKGNYANYNLDAWNDRRLMPVGWAGGFAFLVGVAGWVMGMAETLYTGVIAAQIGSTGGDVGNELSFVFTIIAYIPARWLEYRLVGR